MSKEKKEKGRLYHISLGKLSTERFEELQKHYDYEGEPSSMFKMLINTVYDGDYRRIQYGYQSGMKTAKTREIKGEKDSERDEVFKNMEGMDDAVLSRFLIDIGFSPGNEYFDFETKAKKFIVRTNSVGIREYGELHEDVATEKQVYYRSIWTWTEMIKNVQKDWAKLKF